MKKKFVSALLALVMCLSLLPGTAFAAEGETLPDWYFLFAIFKNVDADGVNKDGEKQRAKGSLTQDEVDAIRVNARDFEEYMNQLGVIRAHVDIVEIDTPVTELHNEYSGGSYISQEQATPLLQEKVVLDRYDHITCIASLGISTSYGGITGSEFENGTGHSCLNCTGLPRFIAGTYPWSPGYPVHEFLHFMERMSAKWDWNFGLHDIMNNFYERVDGEYEACYTDILLNRAKGTAGTGVHPAVWQYPPHVLRTMTELTVPSGVTSIGSQAFRGCTTLTEATIPGSVTEIGKYAFSDCFDLTGVILAPGVTSIGMWAFGCHGTRGTLAKVTIPASVTSIGYAAFYNTGIEDVYYEGTEAQWKAIQIDEYNSDLTKASIHYNGLMADVKTTDYFAQPVVWALEQGITAGTGGCMFSPGTTCTQAQILTFLWRANGSPKPAGAVSGSEYYAAAAQWAKEQGLVDGTFSAGTPCTRSMAVTYLWKLAGSPKTGASSFTDVPSGAAYAQAVSWAVEKGVTAGTGADTFSPNSPCTRGQIVTFLYRALR